jgi:phosphopantothenoylcysteine decarboxylase
MANVLLGVTGSVAAIKVPELYAALVGEGHRVKVVATHASLYFFDPAALSPPARDPAVVVLDEDEWPGRDEGRRWRRDDEVLHIALRNWADLLAIAPLDANTLAKLAPNGCASWRRRADGWPAATSASAPWHLPGTSSPPCRRCFDTAGNLRQ